MVANLVRSEVRHRARCVLSAFDPAFQQMIRLAVSPRSSTEHRWIFNDPSTRALLDQELRWIFNNPSTRALSTELRWIHKRSIIPRSSNGASMDLRNGSIVKESERTRIHVPVTPQLVLREFLPPIVTSNSTWQPRTARMQCDGE